MVPKCGTHFGPEKRLIFGPVLEITSQFCSCEWEFGAGLVLVPKSIKKRSRFFFLVDFFTVLGPPKVCDFWASKTVEKVSRGDFQAAISWQWMNSIRSSAETSGKRVLLMNLDETYINYYFGNNKGHLAVTKRNMPLGRRPLSQRVSRNQLRMGITHVGLICNIPNAQVRLPQVFICPEKVLLARDLAWIDSVMPSNFYFLRARSKWMSVPIMVWIMRLIRIALQPFWETHVLVLMMDVLACHFDPLVTEAARVNGIILHFVPPKLTWLLQPCDTHVFALLKRCLRALFLSWRASNRSDMPPMRDWFVMVQSAVDQVLNQRHWMKAFSQNGYSQSQTRVCDFIRKHISADFSWSLSSVMPSEDQLRIIFPSHRTLLDVKVFMPPPLLALGHHPVLLAIMDAPESSTLVLPKRSNSGLVFETSDTASRAKPCGPVLKHAPACPSKPKAAPITAKSSMVSKALAASPLPSAPSSFLSKSKPWMQSLPAAPVKAPPVKPMPHPAESLPAALRLALKKG